MLDEREHFINILLFKEEGIVLDVKNCFGIEIKI